MAMIDKEIQLLMLKGEKGDPGIAGDYNELTNKPKINGVELLGNKTASDLGLASEADLNAAVADIATNAANIATNTTNISTNTANISANTANISANTANIATNTTNISTNTADIATNRANIGALNNLTTTVKSSLVAAINEVNSGTFSKNVEYGTWTPTINDSAVTVSDTAAIYYRVGRLVYVNARIVISSVSGATTSSLVVLRGLPYALEGSSDAARNRLFLVYSTNGCITATDYPCVAHWYALLGDRTVLQVFGGNSSTARWVDSTDGTVFLTGVYCTNA